jgi:hypothetical protein
MEKTVIGDIKTAVAAGYSVTVVVRQRFSAGAAGRYLNAGS